MRTATELLYTGATLLFQRMRSAIAAFWKTKIVSAAQAFQSRATIVPTRSSKF